MTDRQHAAQLAIALRELLSAVTPDEDSSDVFQYYLEYQAKAAQIALAAWDRHHNEGI